MVIYEEELVVVKFEGHHSKREATTEFIAFKNILP
jgi:hypothetical protein